MKKEFNKLANVLERYDLTEYGDELDMALKNLENKIDEVEKRMECARRSATEVTKTIAKFTETVDDGLVINMGVNDHDAIERGAHDVITSLDLNEDMCIKDNWYGLFSTAPKVEDEETYPIVNCMDCGHPQPLLEENVHVDKLGRHVVCEQCEGSFNVGGDVEVFMTFHSSWGEIDCDSEGNVLEIRGDEYASDGERSYLYDIAKFDLVEFGKFCENENITMGEADDILVIGFWKKDDTYNEGDRDWRKSGDTPPTVLCQTPQTHELIKDIIAKLKVIDVDGETMEYILEQVGMKEQMLKQLFTQTTNDDVDNLLDIRDGRS